MLKTMTLEKQSGKVTTIVIVASGASSAALKYRDTGVYQVGAHGDYIQEKN